MIWLLVQSPILHVIADHLDAADAMVKTANASGMKYSHIKSVKGKIVVELGSTERLDAPLGIDGVSFCSEGHLQLLVDIANDIMHKSQNKLLRLQEHLQQL